MALCNLSANFQGIPLTEAVFNPPSQGLWGQLVNRQSDGGVAVIVGECCNIRPDLLADLYGGGVPNLSICSNNPAGRAPRFIVGQQRALPTIRRIVEAGADPMTIDGSGITSVHLAPRLEQKDIARLLLTLWETRRGFNGESCPVGKE